MVPMRRLLLLAAAALLVVAWAPAPADAIVSLGCPSYDTRIDAPLGTLHLAQTDPRHTGAWMLEVPAPYTAYYFTHDGASANDELWTNVWVQHWEETNGIAGLQRGQEVCFNCYVGDVMVECDAWLTGP